MRRSLFWFWLFVALIAVAACNLRRDASRPGENEPTATSTPESPVPVPTLSDPAASEATTPDPGSPGFALPEVKLPEVEVPAGALATAQAALQQAGDAAGTAVKQAGDVAGTAAVVATEQGGAALATVQAISTPDFSQLVERLAAARPNSNGELSVTLNESELNQLLQLRYLVMSAEPEVRDATVRFQSGAIVLKGSVPLILPVEVMLSLRPVVADGQFELEIVNASLGRLQAPELVLGFASNLVSSALSDAIRLLPEGFELQSITVAEGLLTISGRINN